MCACKPGLCGAEVHVTGVQNHWDLFKECCELYGRRERGREDAYMKIHVPELRHVAANHLIAVTEDDLA